MNKNEIAKIQEVLYKKNGVIAFPTDTVWGIGCIVESKKAVDKIYEMKHRDRTKPLILLGSDINSLLKYTKNIPIRAIELAEKHLPGALTIIVPKNDNAPDYITAGYDTIGIRIPNCPIFLEILENVVEEHVLATTSANISGQVSGISMQQVKDELGGSVDYILDPQGFESIKQASTIVSVSADNKIKILRQGSIIIEV